MNAALQAAALLLSAAGVVCFASALTRRVPFATALRMTLELWMAAGLLRLSAGHDAWRTIGTVALLVAVRTLVGWGLAHGARRGLPPRVPPARPPLRPVA